jgi:hypothetical protein
VVAIVQDPLLDDPRDYRSPARDPVGAFNIEHEWWSPLRDLGRTAPQFLVPRVVVILGVHDLIVPSAVSDRQISARSR